MRIITGKYKGRKLETPDNYDVRPTSDKVKEAIFSMLMYEVEDAVCADLFAGTGNLGLEALSRGASKCYFSDNDRTSIALVKANVEKCGAEAESVIIAGDYMKALRRISEPLDLIFLDPPYESGYYGKALETIDSLDLLSQNGIIIAEHGKRTDLPAQVGGLVCFKKRRYGKSDVSLYARETSVHCEESDTPGGEL